MIDVTWWQARIESAIERLRDEDEGFSTAELLGNAALGILALVVIWAGLRAVGLDVIAMVRQQLLGDEAGG